MRMGEAIGDEAMSKAIAFIRRLGTPSTTRVAPAPVPLHDAPPAISPLDAVHRERRGLGAQPQPRSTAGPLRSP